MTRRQRANLLQPLVLDWDSLGLWEVATSRQFLEVAWPRSRLPAPTLGGGVMH